MYTKYIVIAVVYLSIVFTIYFIYNAIKKNRDFKINTNKKINRKRNKLYALYKFYRNFPFVNKIFQRVLENTKSFYPADEMSINKEATRIMTKGVARVVIGIIVTLFLSKGDIWYICMGTLASCILFHMNIIGTFRKQEYMLLEQLKVFISRVRTHYGQSHIIEDAVEDCLDEIPYEIGLHISRIHEILTSPLMEEKMEEYMDTSPNRFLKLLLSICTSNEEYGSGDNTFLDTLMYLQEEVDNEILNLRNIKEKFTAMSGICISTIFFLKPAETWAISNMTELKDFYEGKSGRISMMSIFLIVFICYYMIDALKETRRGEIITKNIWSWIANLPHISTFLNKVVNKNYVKMIRINEMMKEIGDHTGPKAYLAKRMIFAVGAFLLIIFAVASNTIKEKVTMLTSYAAEFDSSIVPNEKYRTTMQETAYNLANSMKNTPTEKLDREEIKSQVVASGIESETYAELIADNVIEELTKYHNTYFHWYVLIIALAGAGVGFYIPHWYLRFKCNLATATKEDEVAQYQTLALVLSNADGIGVSTLLEWMSRFAYAFKASIDDCILELELGEKQALEKLQMQEENQSFQNFIDCLLAVDDTDMKTAFSSIEVSRKFSLNERKQNAEKLADRHSGTARFFAFAPTLVLVFGYLIGPMAVLAIRKYLEMDLNMNSIF